MEKQDQTRQPCSDSGLTTTSSRHSGTERIRLARLTSARVEKLLKQHHMFCMKQRGSVVSASDLWSGGRGFDSKPRCML
ncbi:hypothetical protein ElyMa_001233000 [Elysia marginata]|uniref:Uncharacterized protein n=1 Tax=Elysia marginata TaxID=1093978 RepID=A0AAV4IBA9_9GAST|nr:hypothetical protein ElyMa_001233000 [Elysia marginata]